VWEEEDFLKMSMFWKKGFSAFFFLSKGWSRDSKQSSEHRPHRKCKFDFSRFVGVSHVCGRGRVWVQSVCYIHARLMTPSRGILERRLCKRKKTWLQKIRRQKLKKRMEILRSVYNNMVCPQGWTFSPIVNVHPFVHNQGWTYSTV
jgi:hypothetical protein